jgi:hypothetical protein
MMTFPRRASNQKWRFCLGETRPTPRKTMSILQKTLSISGLILRLAAPSYFGQEELNLAVWRSD